jgi:hypothetical protein
VGAGAGKLQPIGFHVKIAEAAPFPLERMIAVGLRKRRPIEEKKQDHLEFPQIFAASLKSLHVSLEPGRPNRLPHI